jgi:hypothetical protein
MISQMLFTAQWIAGDETPWNEVCRHNLREDWLLIAQDLQLQAITVLVVVCSILFCGPQNVILAAVLVFQLEIYPQHPGSANRREHQRKQSTSRVFPQCPWLSWAVTFYCSLPNSPLPLYHRRKRNLCVWCCGCNICSALCSLYYPRCRTVQNGYVGLWGTS